MKIRSNYFHPIGDSVPLNQEKNLPATSDNCFDNFKLFSIESDPDLDSNLLMRFSITTTFAFRDNEVQ